MRSIITKPDYFIFMKVGNHAQENFDAIIERKKKEYETAGRTFWGYGGATCHPLNQVQPFAKNFAEKQGSLYFLMQYINSNADPDLYPATKYSVDGKHWQPLPHGISVTGSRYAMVLSEIKPGDLTINTLEYKVGIGNSRGKNASEYLRGHVDKGCFVREERTDLAIDREKEVKIAYLAELIEPYAVLLR